MVVTIDVKNTNLSRVSVFSGGSVRGGVKSGGNGGGILEDMDSVITLSYKQRIVGFLICLIAGAIIVGLSFISIHTTNIRLFVVFFSIGNIIIIFSTMFLMGPINQLKLMFHPVRIVATLIYLASIALTIYFGAVKRKLILALLFGVIESYVLNILLIFCLKWRSRGRMVMEIAEVDVEGAADSSSISEDEVIEVQDFVTQTKRELKDLREKIILLRRAMKNADKQQKKAIQEDIAALEEDETKKQQHAQADKFSALKAKKLAKTKAKAEEKAAKELEAQASAIAMPNLGKLERESFEKILDADHLCIYEIEPDGNCLFAAIAHQLDVRHGRIYSQQSLRNLAAEYILGNSDKYSGFIDNDGSLEEYCKRLCGHDLWGGHLEIDAIVAVLGIPIKVYQADAAPIAFGDYSTSIKPITICFQKYAYSLGEHYDSLIDT